MKIKYKNYNKLKIIVNRMMIKYNNYKMKYKNYNFLKNNKNKNISKN